ncbi:MAG: hypothetical protein AAGH79_19315 [Bacteroidota bacterium]
MALSQALVLRFHKKSPSQSVLTVIRADGTITWSKLYPGMEVHDLAHYAIETELSLSDAFYGLLADGYDIQDFELPRDQRPVALIPANLPLVSLQVEYFVNLLLTELQHGSPITDFIEQLSKMLAEAKLPPLVSLDEPILDEIRKQLRVLLIRWKAVSLGEAMELGLQ